MFFQKLVAGGDLGEKDIIFKMFFDINLRKHYYSSKSRDSSVIATNINL